MTSYFDTNDLAHRFLGRIPVASSAQRRAHGVTESAEDDLNLDAYSRRDDANRRAGSRDLDEGGGVASEVGGTRNYHHSGGATGGDLGNRPE
jgi:hypothetical protein